MKSIFISAGEQSGELHGSSLMHELKKISDLSFTGLGGDKMRAEGLNVIEHVKDLAATGIAEVVKKYGYFRKVLKKCSEKIKEMKPDAVVLIDYPGFNLRLAEEIRGKYKGKIIYYISPQLWAWHEKRVFKIKKVVDKMLVVFPFEVEFYKRYGIDAEYVGHPLVKRIKDFLENTFRESPADNVKTITLLPGSRNDEIKHHLPVLIETINLLKKDFMLKLYISRSQAVNKALFDPFVKDLPDFEIICSDVYKYVYNSDLVMTKAGTSTMECSLIGTPFLIFYKTYPLNYILLKPLVKINNIGIVNIIAGNNMVKEFIQKDFNAGMLYKESNKILSDFDYRNTMQENLKQIWDFLGNNNASQIAAERINQLALS